MSTIRDIAKMSGVSYPTVSYVLNHSRPVSEKTRTKVFAAIDKAGYIPSAVARGLSRKRMDTIGVLATIPMKSLFNDNFQGKIIEAALLSLRGYNQSCMFHFAQSMPENPARVSLYCDGRCDGLLVIGQPTDSDFIKALRARSFPIVCITEAWETSGVPYFDVDQEQMMQTLAEMLIHLGHRKIAVLCGDHHTISCAQRKVGCLMAFEKAGLTSASTPFIPGAYSDQSGYANTRSLFTELPKASRPTALICFNDYIAHGAASALAELGLQCPQDVSIVGVDDAAPPAGLKLSLTTMRLPLKEMGERAIDLLLSTINGETNLPLYNKFPAQLVVRDSAAPPNS
jgi:LacI family transcriptional regulator